MTLREEVSGGGVTLGEKASPERGRGGDPPPLGRVGGGGGGVAGNF